MKFFNVLRDQAAPGRDFAHLLGADGQDDVVHARGHGHRRHADGLHARRAVVRDPRDGFRVEVQGFGERGSARAVEAPAERQVRAQPGGLDVLTAHARILIGLEGGFHHEIVIALLEEFSEFRDAHADDGDFSGDTSAHV